jgi:hypothetical protein
MAARPGVEKVNERVGIVRQPIPPVSVEAVNLQQARKTWAA